MQITLDFSTSSPINTERLNGQNRRLYDYLQGGGKIRCFHHSVRDLRIGFLNSRISDLINKWHVTIHKQRVRVRDVEGNDVVVIEYSMEK